MDKEQRLEKAKEILLKHLKDVDEVEIQMIPEIAFPVAILHAMEEYASLQSPPSVQDVSVESVDKKWFCTFCDQYVLDKDVDDDCDHTVCGHTVTLVLPSPSPVPSSSVEEAADVWAKKECRFHGKGLNYEPCTCASLRAAFLAGASHGKQDSDAVEFAYWLVENAINIDQAEQRSHSYEELYSLFLTSKTKKA